MIHAPDISVLYIAALFLICYWVLRLFLFRPLAEILDTRVAESLAAEKIYLESLHEYESTLRVYEDKLLQRKRENSREREEHRAAAQAVRQARLEQARTTAASKLAEAVAEIDAESTRARQSLAAAAEPLGREIATKLAGRQL